jgi:hypothetical protein
VDGEIRSAAQGDHRVCYDLGAVPEGTQAYTTFDFPALPCRAFTSHRYAAGPWFVHRTGKTQSFVANSILSPRLRKVNALSSEKLSLLGNSATVYSVLVDVESTCVKNACSG